MIITYIALTTALLAVIVGPWLAARTARKIMISQMRQQWIAELRTLLSQVLNEADQLRIMANVTKLEKEEIVAKANDINLFMHQISFMLEMSEPNHANLLQAIIDMVDGVTIGSKKKYNAAEIQIITLGREILGSEWKEIEKH